MTDPRPTQFDADQYDHAYPEGIERHWWHIARNGIVLDWLRRDGVTEKIVDVGCGRGIVLAHLREAGIDSVGVELGVAKPLPSVREHIRYGVDALTLPAEERAGYRAMTLFDVIEHLPDAQGFLRALLAAYPNVRRVVITVPACPELWSSFDSYHGHYRRYTMASLRELAEQAGCRVARTSYFFHSPYLPARLLAGEGKQRSTQVFAPQGFGIAVNRAIAGVMRLDYAFLPGALKGSSLIATLDVEGR